MSKEFNLKKERMEIFKGLEKNENIGSFEINWIMGMIEQQDREFIQLLKEKLKVHERINWKIVEVINKLAGEDD